MINAITVSSQVACHLNTAPGPIKLDANGVSKRAWIVYSFVDIRVSSSGNEKLEPNDEELDAMQPTSGWQMVDA